MATKKGKALTVVLGCLVLLILLSVVVCCGGGALLFIAGPGMLAGFVVSDEPLDVHTVKWDEARVEALAEEVGRDAVDDRTIELSGEELTQFVLAEAEEELVAFRIDIDDSERAVFDLSLQPDMSQPQYVNLHAIAEFTIEDGWFTHFQVDELSVGKFDVGQYMAGQELKDNVNQSLAQQRVQDPDVGKTFDMVEYLGVENGRFVLKLSEEGLQQLQQDGKL